MEWMTVNHRPCCLTLADVFFQHTFGFNSVVAINGQDATVMIWETWGKGIMGSIA
jgi:hypothetical protein